MSGGRLMDVNSFEASGEDGALALARRAARLDLPDSYAVLFDVDGGRVCTVERLPKP